MGLAVKRVLNVTSLIAHFMAEIIAVSLSTIPEVLKIKSYSINSSIGI